MVEYTFSTTAEQDKLLKYFILEVVNPKRAEQNPPLLPVTLTEFLMLSFNTQVNNYTGNALIAVNNNRANAYARADSVVQAEVDNLLNTSLPRG